MRSHGLSALPRWLQEVYDALFSEFQDRPFRFSEAVEALREHREIPENQVTAILSELRRRGWLHARPDPDDRRKRIYHLILPHERFRKYLPSSQSKLSRAELERLLKQAADLIRTRVDYTFILVLLFL